MSEHGDDNDEDRFCNDDESYIFDVDNRYPPDPGFLSMADAARYDSCQDKFVFPEIRGGASRFRGGAASRSRGTGAGRFGGAVESRGERAPESRNKGVSASRVGTAVGGVAAMAMCAVISGLRGVV